MKNITLLFVGVIMFIFVSSPAFAQYGQYGGESPSYSILVDKLVGKPSSATKGGVTDYQYIDNLSPSDPRFKENQEVFFKLIVKNTSTTTLSSITVKDFVPSYLNPIEGPGTYDEKNRVISFNAGDFATGEEKIYFLKMQVLAQKYLPADKGLFCVVNKAQAYNDKTSDDDSSQLCIEKQVAGVTTTPSAGPEMGLILLIGNFAILGTGYLLKKRV